VAALSDFNQTPENEDSAKGYPRTSSKRKQLDDFLKDNGFAEIPDYNVFNACENRKKNLSELQAGDYPATILGTPDECPTKR